jgi:hypothetical protein
MGFGSPYQINYQGAKVQLFGDILIADFFAPL